MAQLRFLPVPACTPDRFVRIGAGLLAGMAAEVDPAPILVVAELKGPSILLGRHQRLSSALASERLDGLEVHRRLGGGRAILASDGTLGIYLVVPGIGSLLSAPVGADKLINRYVRGLNAGLTLAGAARGAHWFGRDFISADSRQLGRVSQDGLQPVAGRATGPALLEAFVAISEGLSLPRSLSGYPEAEDPRAEGPEAVSLSEWVEDGIDFESIAAKIASGYERVYGCSLVPWEGDVPELVPPGPGAVEDEAGFEESGVADVPIGFAEALVRHDGERVLEVRLRGDFIAPAFVIRGIEEALVGCPLDFTQLGTRIDTAFQQPGAMVLGLRSLRVLADAVLAAAGKL